MTEYKEALEDLKLIEGDFFVSWYSETIERALRIADKHEALAKALDIAVGALEKSAYKKAVGIDDTLRLTQVNELAKEALAEIEKIRGPK